MPTNQEKLAHLASLASRTKDPAMLAKITAEQARISGLMHDALSASFEASQPPAPAVLPPAPLKTQPRTGPIIPHLPPAPAVIPPIASTPRKIHVSAPPAPVVATAPRQIPSLPPLPSIPTPKPESVGAAMVRKGVDFAKLSAKNSQAFPPTPASPSGDDRTTPPITSFKPMDSIPMEAKVDTVEHIDPTDMDAALAVSILRLARLREQKKLCKPNSNEFWRMKEAIDVERDHYFDLKNKIQEARMAIRDEMYSTFAADQLAAIAELSMVMKTLTSSMNELATTMERNFGMEDLPGAQEDLHVAQLAVVNSLPADAPIMKIIEANKEAQSLSDQDKAGEHTDKYPQPKPELTVDGKVAPVGTDRDMTDVITDLIPRLSKQGKRTYCPYCCKYFMEIDKHLLNNKRCNTRLVDEYGGN